MMPSLLRFLVVPGVVTWAALSGFGACWIYVGAGYQPDPRRGREYFQVRQVATQRLTGPDGSVQEVIQEMEQSIEKYPERQGSGSFHTAGLE